MITDKPMENEFQAIRECSLILYGLGREGIARVLWYLQHKHMTCGLAFRLRLVEVGEKKIQCIKAVRRARPDLGLKECKELVESAPVFVEAPADKLRALLTDLQQAGATIEVFQL